MDSSVIVVGGALDLSGDLLTSLAAGVAGRYPLGVAPPVVSAAFGGPRGVI